MKVLWIADFGLQHNIGGAQRTDSFVIQEGINRGHDIVFLNYDTPSDVLNDTYDLVVTGNLGRCLWRTVSGCAHGKVHDVHAFASSGSDCWF